MPGPVIRVVIFVTRLVSTEVGSMQQKQKGFTLIEIAIVLLIIGLLLGGVLKGQSMINSARVRAIANDLSGIETAWVSFQDRYQSLPGDYSRASTHIVSGAADGNANARVDTVAEAGAVWQHLAGAGFITGNFTGAAVTSLADGDCDATICPGNPYSGFYKIANSSNALGQGATSHELSTGGNIPVEVMYELDLKIDDGVAGTGRLRAFDAPPYNTCITNNEWDVVSGAADCAAVLELPL